MESAEEEAPPEEKKPSNWQSVEYQLGFIRAYAASIGSSVKFAEKKEETVADSE